MSHPLQVEVEQGVLQGTLVDYPLGLPYKSFLGIPYAKPPVGDLRFRDPIPADRWDGVLDATQATKYCAQFDIFDFHTYLGEEDCLYLNVYTPGKTKKGDNLPVMFWIHGGGYYAGDGGPVLYGGGHLVQHDVILVGINYRLGPLGFICLDIEEAAGNMGLKDIALALRWVSKNISAFGGDPNNVTVFGESAGASATHHIITSPLTEGLYKRAILLSNVGFSEWTLSENVESATFKLGEILGMKTTDKKELINFLKSVDVKDLVMASPFPIHEPIDFGPVVEKNIPNVTPFCVKDLRTRLLDGDFPKVSMMIGCTSNEGFLYASFMAEQFELGTNKKIDLALAIPNMTYTVPKHLLDKFDDIAIEKAIIKIKEFYFPKEDDVLEGYQDFHSDHKFIKDIYFTIKKYAKHVPTYFYHFTYKGASSYIPHFLPKVIEYRGTAHSEQNAYLFTANSKEIFGPNFNIEPTKKDIMTIKRMTEMWTNFAKYGNPTPKITNTVPIKWDPVDLRKMNCMEIGESLRKIEYPYKERVKFWENLEYL